MSKLSTKKRNSLPDSAFAGPDRSYPITDKAHAANAKARATQQYGAGNLSESARDKIKARANAMLDRAAK
jgi:hypothetical protein